MKIIYPFFLICTLSYNLFSQIHWSELNSGVNVQLNSVRFASHTAVWICGNNGTVLKNNNSVFGDTIRNVSGGGIPANATLVHIACRNSAGDTSNALVAGNIGTTTYVWRTTNGGGNWTQVFSQPNGFINAIWDWYPNLTFMQGNPVGGRWSLWRSTNFGLTWDSAGLYLQQAGSEHGWPNSMYSVDTNRIWFGTNNSRIYYSSNSGYNWVILPTAPEQNIYALLVGINLGFAGGSTLMRSTDYGLNWNQISGMGSGNFGGFAFLAFVTYTYYVRGDNNIYMSSNFGQNWFLRYTAPSGNYKHIFGLLSTQFMYAVRDNGGITRTYGLPFIKPISSEIPSSFSLSQNYPNPFNPTTKIQFALPKNAFAKLIIYDVLGREVETLVNEQLAHGIYEVNWDATNYPSGVYFYRLAADNYVESRKMILVK
jgi:photosystem II stability/assembly factor-like uncharacterized protein